MYTVDGDMYQVDADMSSVDGDMYRVDSDMSPVDTDMYWVDGDMYRVDADMYREDDDITRVDSISIRQRNSCRSFEYHFSNAFSFACRRYTDMDNKTSPITGIGGIAGIGYRI